MGAMGGKLRIAPVRRLALTPQLRRSLDLLRMDAADLARLLDDEAATNPWLVLSRPAVARGSGADIAAPGPGLYTHVLDWIEAHFPPGHDRAMALALAEVLDPTGRLGESPAAVAASAGVAPETLLKVLHQLQRMEPAGLFARDLAECLRLQAQAAGGLDDAMLAVLARLDLVARGGAAVVARAAHLPEATIAAAIARLRRFDPKPGLVFDTSCALPAPRPLPDLLARRVGGTWRAALNATALPHAGLRPGAGPADTAARAAADLVAALDRRNSTLVAVADAVLAMQGAALDHGPAALRPLTRAAVAQATGLAASTVGRALHGARIVTPQGTLRMATFFSAALGAEGSAAQAQTTLRALIAAEDPAHPLSDAALTDRLVAQGIAVSRRTVAKYRDRLGLPPAHLRQRTAGR